MRKTILTLIALAVLALFIVSCKPGEIGPGKAIAGVQQPNWVPFYQCHETTHKGYDFFYTTDTNCFGQTVHAKLGVISTTPFEGSVLLSECARTHIKTTRHPITRKKSERRSPDKYIIQGKVCPPGDTFSHEFGYAYANQAPGTFAFWRCWSEDQDGIWDHWASFNPNCPSDRLGRNAKPEFIAGYLPKSVPTTPTPGFTPTPIVKKPEAPYTCTGDRYTLRINQEDRYTVSDERYDFRVIFSSKDGVKFLINGQVTDLIKQRTKYKFGDNLVIDVEKTDGRVKFCLNPITKEDPCADYIQEITELKRKITERKAKFDQKIAEIKEECERDSGKCPDIQKEVDALKKEVENYEKLLDSLKELLKK